MSISRVFRRSGMVLGLVLAGCLPDSDQFGPGPGDPSDPIVQPIVGGTRAGPCMWPTCVSAGGCSNTLIHPKIVTTAKHCLGSPRSITFGETRSGAARTVQIERCLRSPVADVGFCILREEVNDVPIVPVLSACEARDMIKRGQPAVLAGFGNLGSGMSSGGRKYFVELTINALVGNGREVDLGTREVGACNGDSGGPAYLKMPDGTWRAFGVTSRKGPGGGNCASSTIYGLISAHIDWIEMESGLDITPCHGPNGWEGGPNCDRFPTDPGGTSNGTWMTMCSSGPVARPIPTCTGGPSPPVPDGGSTRPRDAGGTSSDGRRDVATVADTGNASPPDVAGDGYVAPPPADAAVAPPVPPDAAPPSPTLPDGAGADPDRPPATTAPGVVKTAGCACALAAADDGAHPGGIALLALAAAAVMLRRPRRARPTSSRR